jgi:hypothetical protein
MSDSKVSNYKNAVQEAILDIQKAVEHLKNASVFARSKGNYSDDTIHYVFELESLLSCDNGEAGLFDLVKRIV